MAEERKGFKLIKTFPLGESVVGIINFRDRIIIAITRSVYELKYDNVFEPLQIKKPLRGYVAS